VVRLAIDEQIFAIQAYGGISRLFAELSRQFIRHIPAQVQLIPMNAPIVTRYVLDDPELVGALGVREAKNEWTALARYLARPRLHPKSDIVHNTFYLPHGLASTRGAKRIVTVHDMIPELMPHTRRRLDLLTLKKRYVEQADHIICISEATKTDLLAVYGEVRPPISVVYHGVDPKFQPDVARVIGLPEQYILMVGNRDQYKDGAVLIRAFGRIATEFPNVHLVCVGGGTWTREERSQIDELGLTDRAVQTSLSDELMPAAYANARVFVFPSRFEGFGLPAVEAMASGTPTILAEATSLPEVGGDAALYFAPGDDAALAEGLTRVLGDPVLAADLARCGLERSRAFTWQATAEGTAAAYAQSLSS
jgi:glycosyltransferase involved in cell wall biosynthesis